MSEETTTTEEINVTEDTTTNEQSVSVQAKIVVSYLEEIDGALTMLASNINNQSNQLKELIDNPEKETNNG